MKVVFIHFHLKTGGVTSVIKQQVRALMDHGGQALILTGDCSDNPFPAYTIEIPGLGYTDSRRPPPDPSRVCEDIAKAVSRRWPTGPDLVHVHNPTLAKNKILQASLKGLQRRGMPLLCQIHDFAEDGRPGAFFPEPYVCDCHYAVLNARDYHLLHKAGLQKKGLHLLPNPVPSLLIENTEQSVGLKHVLYPVRAIRRKNIGEALLISLYFKDQTPLVITLPPNSPLDCRAYKDWVKFTDQYQMNTVFEAGLKQDYKTLVAGSRYVLTTSITEGFGYSFLEPWTAGKAVWGRLLPDICSDFIDQKVGLSHLYKNLRVPLSWLPQALEQKWQDAHREAACRFGLPFLQDDLHIAWHKVSAGDEIDFGLLDESSQRHALKQILADRSSREHLAVLNPFLQSPGPPEQCQALIGENRRIIKQHYNPVAYGEKLLRIYQQAATESIVHTIDKQLLAKAFLTPETFSLLKWGQVHA